MIFGQKQLQSIMSHSERFQTAKSARKCRCRSRGFDALYRVLNDPSIPDCIDKWTDSSDDKQQYITRQSIAALHNIINADNKLNSDANCHNHNI